MTWDLYNFILANSIIIIGTIFQMVSGVSVGIIISPFLAIISYTLVPTSVIMASLSLTILMAIKYRKFVDTKSIYLIALASILGVVATIFIMKFINTSNLDLLFGSLTLLAVAFSLKIKSIKLRGKFAFFTGFISGLMGSLASVGGHLLAILYQNHKIETIKGSLAFIYTIFSSFMLISFYYSDTLHLEHVISSAYMMPGFIIGFLISPFFISRFNSKYAKPVILILASIGGSILILKHFIF